MVVYPDVQYAKVFIIGNKTSLKSKMIPTWFMKSFFTTKVTSQVSSNILYQKLGIVVYSIAVPVKLFAVMFG